MMNLTDESARIAELRTGNSEAFAQLWNSITPRLMGYLVNSLRDKTLAEDILQATWTKALDALPRFRDTGRGIAPWLFAIARNECLQYWRSHKKEQPFDPLLHDKAPDTVNHEDAIVARQILQNLAENDRELLRLRFIADLPITDIAKVLNINVIAVRVRLHRALARARVLAVSK